MTDLFLTDKERLWEWIKTQKFVRTSQIMRWGSNGGYSNRAARNARELAKQGKLRRLKKDEIVRFGFKTKEGIYEVLT